MACCPTCGQAVPQAGFVIDVDASRVLIEGRLIKLRPMEAAILKVLSDRMSQCVGTDRLFIALHGATGIPDSADTSLRVTIHNLRRRISTTVLSIVNHRSEGYSLHFLPEGLQINRRAA